MKISFKLIVLFLSISLLSFAKNPKFDFEKSKTISKTYTTNANATTSITNLYGNVNVYLTDLNSVSIQVTIKVSGKNETKVNDRLNAIDVNFTATSANVNAKTIFASNNNNGNNNLSYEINYIVTIPKNGNIELNNKYGNLYADKINGNTSINCKYGSINFGALEGKSNEITMAYSQKSEINSVKTLQLNSQYSDLTIQKSELINASGNYNTFNFHYGTELNLNSNYTKIFSENLKTAMIYGNYMTIKLADITYSLVVYSNYSDIKCQTTTTTKFLNIKGNYSNTKIYIEPNSNFDFEITTKYGSFKSNLNLNFTEKTEKGTSANYLGYYNSTSKGKITATTSYGNIQFLKK